MFLQAHLRGHGHQVVRDLGLLDATAARPRSSVFGTDAYPDLDAKAAALLHSIVTGHPLVDGYKRLGWVAVRLFYLLNDADIRPLPDAAFERVVGVADGQIRDIGGSPSDWRPGAPEARGCHGQLVAYVRTRRSGNFHLR